MKKYFPFCLLILFLLSCEKNNNTDESAFWYPDIRLEKGEGQVNLFITDPRPYTEYNTLPPSNPEFFEIYYSENLSSFNLYNKVGASERKVPITALKNQKAYYFYVLTGKKGLQSIISDTLMVIPSQIPEAENFSVKYSFTGINATLSHNHSYLSFIIDNFLYYKPLNDISISYIDQLTSAPAWSPSANTLVYIGYTHSGLWLYPFKLMTYNADTKTSVMLSEADYSKYYISTPVFSNDGNIVAFFSSENNSKKEFYDIWKIDVNSKSKSRITSFENSHFTIQGSFCWSADGTEIYLSGYFDGNNKSSLFKYSIGDARLTSLFESDWNDISPSLSPDNSKLAFISDRSGDDEVWNFNRNTNEFQMITGSSVYNFDRRYSGIQWISNNEILISAYHENKPEVLKFNIE